MNDEKKPDNVIDLAEERERREALEKLQKESGRAARMLLGLGMVFQAVMEPHMEELAKGVTPPKPKHRKRSRRRRKKGK